MADAHELFDFIAQNPHIQPSFPQFFIGVLPWRPRGCLVAADITLNGIVANLHVFSFRTGRIGCPFTFPRPSSQCIGLG